MTFPGAHADRDEADYVLYGAPLDVSTTFQPGSRFGPRRVRHFAETFDDYDHRTDQRFTDLAVHDAGDVRAWDDAPEYLEFLAGTLSDVRDDAAVPLLVGGEHTVTVAGVRATDPDVVVVLDAHLDLREAYDGNEWSHATVTRHALDVAEHAVVLGARTGSEAEWARADEDDVTVVPPEAVADWSLPAAVAATDDAASDDAATDDAATDDADGDGGDGRRVYLSVDVDAADPGFAPGTGTMEPFGLTPRDMRTVVRAVAPHCVGFDVVEVNDRDDGQAAALAAKLLRAFVYEHAATR